MLFVFYKNKNKKLVIKIFEIFTQNNKDEL